LISIIIPTYNRAPLISETLDSIIAQSYQNWECIVIDDGSVDNTLEILENFHEKDKRIRYYTRPLGLKKGANSCRNYGFVRSKGDYIIWFDSDDLMTPDHLEQKVKAIFKSGIDFVVARTQNFKDGQLLEPYKYEKKAYGIKASDFILLKIHWYTYDVMLRREIAEKIEWNEQMKSWQDYNYFCKMLLETENGEYIDQILTHRRLHANSIQDKLTKDPEHFRKELLENRLYTFYDLEDKIDIYTRNELINGMMNLEYELSKFKSTFYDFKELVRLIKKYNGLGKLFLFVCALVSHRIFGKGYMLLNLAKS
jgi:glycosyltransferase involved in cell wall biosynthesis